MTSSLCIKQEDLLYKPRNIALAKMNNISGEPEMSEFESAYLCGLINKFKPKKILEVGVAGGATTGIIIETLQETRDRSENIKIFSVDLNSDFYRNKTEDREKRKTGFMTDIMKNSSDVWVDHSLLLGKTLCDCFEEIDHDIDFVVIDTVHLLPGEILDIPVLLKLVSNNAVIVFHDVSLHHFLSEPKESRKSFATMAAFVSLSGNKNVPIGLDPIRKFPNIAAIQLTENSSKDVSDIFYAMNFPWSYVPPLKIKEAYLQFYDKYYRKYQSIYENAFLENTAYAVHEREVNFETVFSKLLSKLTANQTVSLYGAGEIAEYLVKELSKRKVPIDRIFVTKSSRYEQFVGKFRVEQFSQDLVTKDDVIIVASIKFAKEITNYIKEKVGNITVLSVNEFSYI
ncbi:MAG: class I SAM-dependent methyltransferase [Succinatimonas sp.]|nr:class I SAM-dependent methyltransferase [Succinatimonas sp.]